MRTLSLFPRFAKSRAKIFQLWEPPEMPLHMKYAELIMMLTMCLVYAPFYPPIYLISAAGLFLNYWR